MAGHRVARAVVSACLLAIAFILACRPAAAAPTDGPVQDGRVQDARCASLVHQDFESVMDAATRVVSSRVVQPHDGVPAYCEVRAYVWPQVQFYLWMPLEGWTGRFVGIGCGGACGVIERVDASGIWRPMVRAGDVAMFTDMGHTGRDTTDLLWAIDNPQAQIDYGFRATHVATVAGKAIAAALYGRPPSSAYFVGNSTGGRQGMIEAQRFPHDYQGIVAKCPAISSVASDAIIWALQSLSDRSGHTLLNPDNLRVLTDAVLARCDKLDGVIDGVVSAPERCDFDPVAVSCTRSPVPGCLNAAQLAAVQRAYLGAPSSAGSAVGGSGLPKGSESQWLTRYVSRDGAPTSMWDFMLNWLRVDEPVWQELAKQNAPISLADYDVVRFRTVRGTYQLLHEATNPDLSAFAEQGGRLIMMQGMADVIVQPRETTRYYDTAVRTAGGMAQTQKFFRYFLMPGVGHCFAGDGAGADVFDSLGAITRWVETGEAPERIVALKLKKYHGLFPDLELPAAPENIEFSRPLVPYPAHAVYKGRGDPNSADNFAASATR